MAMPLSGLGRPDSGIAFSLFFDGDGDIGSGLAQRAAGLQFQFKTAFPF